VLNLIALFGGETPPLQPSCWHLVFQSVRCSPAGAIVFLVAGMAVRGEMWAWGVTFAAMSLAITAIVHAAWFGIVWLFAQLPRSRRAAADPPAVDPTRPAAS
jgi:hypothetical protein